MRGLVAVALFALLASACGGDTTTDEVVDTPSEADEAVWSDGTSELRRGDCFVTSTADETTTFDVVDCAVSHDGEVTTVDHCLPGNDEARLAAIGEYVGVGADELASWLESQQLVAMEHWRLGVGSVCFLAAADGQLTASYRR